MKHTVHAGLCLLAALILSASAAGCSSRSAEEDTQYTTTEAVTEPADLSSYDPDTGRGRIYTPEGLSLLRQYPDGHFTLMANIDCGGMPWEPVADFSGSLTGVWAGNRNYTVSNLTIVGEGDVGFFSTLSGRVENLNLEGITLETPADFSGRAGILAASLSGSVTNVRCTDIHLTASGTSMTVGGLVGYADGPIRSCYAEGTLTVTAQGEDNRIGGGAGLLVSRQGEFTNSSDTLSRELSSVEVRVSMKINADGGSGQIGGIYGTSQGPVAVEGANFGADISFSSPTGKYAVSPIAGHLDGQLLSCLSCAWLLELEGDCCESQSSYYGTAAASPLLFDCAVRDCSSTDRSLSEENYALRKKVVDYMYAECTVPWIPAQDMSYSDTCTSKHIQNYVAGETYFGLPYTHRCASLERFCSYIGSDGVLSQELPAVGWEYQLGNDCADCVYWAWSQVSPSITYVLTNDMICQNGTVPVGTYVLANHDSTADTCLLNGPEVMYEAYAQLKMGDGLLEGPGHVRMAAEAAYVFRDESGMIDPTKSYVLIHEQGATTNVELRRSTCQVNKKITFEKLFTGNYIPITVPELVSGQTGTPTVTCDNQAQDFDNMFKGSITSNYRINWIRVCLTDSQGAEIYGITFFPSSGNHNSTFDLSLFHGNVRKDELTPGQTYHFSAFVGVADGQEIPVKDYSFTVE